MVSVLLVVALFSFAFVAVVSVAVTGDNFAVVKELDIVLSVVSDSEAVDE